MMTRLKLDRSIQSLTGGRASWLLPAALLALLTFAAYAPAINGEFIWDDDLYAANPILGRPGGLTDIWTLRPTREVYYREFPAVYTTFWLERRLWGLKTTGYHAVNIALHVLNALLAWAVLKRLGLRGAWLAAAIFALHPVHVESVAWITERKNVLSAFFYLLALEGYLRFEEKSGRGWYLAALGCFAAALLSKPVACTLPVVLLLLRWRRAGAPDRGAWMNLLPFFLLALGSGLFTMKIEQGQLGPEFHLPWVQRILLASRALWFYPMKLAWPAGLAFSYERWTLDAHDFRQWLWVLGTLAAGTWLWRARARLGRGVPAAAAFYAVTIAPLLGFVAIYTFRYTFVADHYQYLASLGPIALAVAAASRFLDERKRFVVGAAVLTVLGAGTWRQAHAYRSLETIWSDTLVKNPSSWLAENNLGFVRAGQGRLDEAIEHYRRSLLLNKDYSTARDNWGVALYAQGRTAEAIAQFIEAGKLDPYSAPIRRNLGVAFLRAGRAQDAADQHRVALHFKPDFASAHAGLGDALSALGRRDEAIPHYRESLRLEPDNAHVRRSLSALAGSENLK